MKAFLASLVALPMAFLLLLVIPIIGGSDDAAANPCSPLGGAPLQVAGGRVGPWGNYSAEQMTNAATIVRVGAQRNVPPRGQQIALMTAIDESGLIPKKQHGMSPSNPETAWGLFQQTPKYGWGTLQQVMDPVYATNTFYDRLVKVPNWQTMQPTLAAHAVQRNADPYVYQQFWDDAGALLAHLTGGSGGTRGPPARIAPAAAAAPGASSNTRAALPAVRIASANVAKHASDIAAVQRTGVDFVALSETTPIATNKLAIAGYAAFRQPGGNGQARSTAVAWRTDRWSLTNGGRVLLVENGPQKWDAGRSATWATLRTADGSQLSVVAVHMMVNPAKGADRAQRQALYLEGMKRLAALISQLSARGPVLVGGDFNSQYSSNDPWGPKTQLAAVGLVPSFDTAGKVRTHDGGGVIDYVFAPSTAAVTGQATMPLASDHSALIVGLRGLGSSTTAPAPGPTYCDSAPGIDGGGSGFQVSAAARYVGPFSAAQLTARAKEFVASGGGWLRRCQNFVAQLAGRPNSGYHSAASATATFRAQGTFHEANAVDGHAPPVGAWLYYSNAGNPYGHVVTYLGNGLVAGTDTWRSDHVGIGPASDITNGRWHLTYEGWAVPWATKSNDVPVKIPIRAAAADQLSNQLSARAVDERFAQIVEQLRTPGRRPTQLTSHDSYQRGELLAAGRHPR